MALPTRNEVSDDLKWDLSRVFKDDQEWEKEYNRVATEIKNLDRFKEILLNLVKIYMKELQKFYL